MSKAVDVLRYEQNELRIVKKFLDAAYDERDEARRWSAAWKKAAWKFRNKWQSDIRWVHAEKNTNNQLRVSNSRLKTECEDAKNIARRWSAAWKKAAKWNYRAEKIGNDWLGSISKQLIEARAIARRLLRERDEARTMLAQISDESSALYNFVHEVQTKNADLQSQVTQLARTVEEQRKRYDAKYAEWSELQTESSRRQAEIRALKALLVDVDKERLELYRVLEMVEFDGNDESGYYYCLWCKSFEIHGHAPDCARQKALGKG